MRPEVRERLLAVGAGLAVGAVAALGMSRVVSAWQLAGVTGLFWLAGVALFVRGYQRYPELQVDPDDVDAWWKATTRRGWALLVVVITLGLGVFYVVFARVLVTVPVPTQVWLVGSMTAMGPAIAGLTALVGGAVDSPFVADGDDSG